MKNVMEYEAVEFNCLPPGTYQIMVGTFATNANTYTITATQGNNAGPVNDFCTNANQIVIGSSDLCVSLPFTSSTINACPETLPPVYLELVILMPKKLHGTHLQHQHSWSAAYYGFYLHSIFWLRYTIYECL